MSLAHLVTFLSIPIAGVFALEWFTRSNLFSIFGGVPATTYARAGQLRCQGPFAHPIIAGTFWAAMLPLIWIQLREGLASKRFGYIGTIACLIIIATTGSSTPVASALVAFFGISLYPWRHYRRAMWAGFFLVAALLHFVIMEQPVYHLMARMDITGGSTGWHRFVILETFINNFSDWFLTGEHNPEKWRWQMRDITNHYIGQGLNGGLLTLSAFVFVVVLAFLNIGRALCRLDSSDIVGMADHEWEVWLIGVAILVHAVTFFALSYFGQMSTLWYVQLALAGCVSAQLTPQNKLCSAITVTATGEGYSRKNEPSEE
jgi:hypothetical protein